MRFLDVYRRPVDLKGLRIRYQIIELDWNYNILQKEDKLLMTYVVNLRSGRSQDGSTPKNFL